MKITTHAWTRRLGPMVLGLALGAPAPAREITLNPAVTFKGQDDRERTLGTFETRNLAAYDLRLLQAILQARGGYSEAAAALGAALAAGEHRPEPSPKPDPEILEEKAPSSASDPDLAPMTDEKDSSLSSSSDLDPERWNVSLAAEITGVGCRGLAVSADGALHLFVNDQIHTVKADGHVEARHLPVKGVSGFTAAPDGGLYIARADAVWKLDAKVGFQIVAGGLTEGSELDSDPLKTELYMPSHLAADEDGNLFIDDWGNDRFLVLDRSGRIHKVTDVFWDRGDADPEDIRGMTASRGVLYILRDGDDDSGCCVTRVAKGGTLLGDLWSRWGWISQVEPSALVAHPLGMLILEEGNLILQEWGSKPFPLLAGGDEALSHRHFHGPGKLMERFLAGTPAGLATGPDGVLYVAFEDRGSNRTLVMAAKPPTRLQLPLDPPPRLDASPKAIRALLDVEGDGAPIRAMTVGPDASVFFVDRSGRRILRLDRHGECTAFAQASGLTSGCFNEKTILADLKADPLGNLYASDSGNHRILRFNAEGSQVTAVLGTGTEGSALEEKDPLATQLDQPGRLALDAAGDLLVPDLGNGRVLKLDLRNRRVTAQVPGLYRDSQGHLFTREGKDRQRWTGFGPVQVLAAPGGRLVIRSLGDPRPEYLSDHNPYVSLFLEIQPDQENVRQLCDGDYRDPGPAVLDEKGGLLAVGMKGQLLRLDTGRSPIRVVERWDQDLYRIGQRVLAMASAPDGALVLATGEGLWLSGPPLPPRVNLFESLASRQTRGTRLTMPWGLEAQGTPRKRKRVEPDPDPKGKRPRLEEPEETKR